LGAEIPDGPRFLHEFAERGWLLVDLVDHPVDGLPEDERARAVEAGIPALARPIGDLRPAYIVAVKATISGAVTRAVAMAGSDAHVLALPFPVRQ
jgi:hypothetical protein